MSNGTKVKKRDGRIEPLDLEKMHLMVEEACTGLAGVSASQVEMTSGIQFYDGITTGEIQEILIRSASDLIDLDHPNYQFVAARLLLFSLRKSLYGKMRELPHLEKHIINCTNIDVYDKEIQESIKENLEKPIEYKYFVPDTKLIRTRIEEYTKIYQKANEQKNIEERFVFLDEYNTIMPFAEVVIYDPQDHMSIGGMYN